MKNAKTKAEILATFIVQNWHYCPIDEEAEVKNCEGWAGCMDEFSQKQCVNCIMNHANDIILKKQN